MRSGFTVYGSRFRNRKTKTPKKKCMRKNHGFRFAASYAIEVLLGLKLCWYNQVYRLDCRYRTFFHWTFVVCNENCNFLTVIFYFSLVLLLARILYLNINAQLAKRNSMFIKRRKISWLINLHLFLVRNASEGQLNCPFDIEQNNYIM